MTPCTLVGPLPWKCNLGFDASISPQTGWLQQHLSHPKKTLKVSALGCRTLSPWQSLSPLVSVILRLHAAVGRCSGTPEHPVWLL